MTARVFVDTCVFLYAHDESEPEKRPRARNWLEHLWREMAGRTSIQVLSEYYLTVSRRLDPGLPADEAWGDISVYFAWRPQPMDEPVISRARLIEQRHHLGWWDCMVVAAAQLQDCAIVLTENLPDGTVYGDVTVRSPFTLDVREPDAAYAARRTASARHRPRGRPKRETVKA